LAKFHMINLKEVYQNGAFQLAVFIDTIISGEIIYEINKKLH